MIHLQVNHVCSFVSLEHMRQMVHRCSVQFLHDRRLDVCCWRYNGRHGSRFCRDSFGNSSFVSMERDNERFVSMDVQCTLCITTTSTGGIDLHCLNGIEANRHMRPTSVLSDPRCRLPGYRKCTWAACAGLLPQPFRDVPLLLSKVLQSLTWVLPLAMQTSEDAEAA